MSLSLIGKPTDAVLERSPAVHLAGQYEWDPSVLDYTHPSGDGEPPWSNDPDERFDPNIDEFGDYTQRSIQTLSILDDSSISLMHCSTSRANQHAIRPNQHVVNNDTPDNKTSGFNLIGSMLILLRKPWNSPPNGESPYLIHSM